MIPSKTIIAFTDVDMNFIPHPLTGDLPIKTNADAIKQAMINLFNLEQFDVPFDQNEFCGLRTYLFRPTSAITIYDIQMRIEWLVKSYEPRVKLISSKVSQSEDESGYIIFVKYNIVDLNFIDTVTYIFERVR